MAEQSDEEIRKAIEDELRRLTVSDVLVQTFYTVSSVGYRRLSKEDRDLDQARLAIESLKALLPTLEGSISADALRDFRQVVANMQLAYASAVGEEPKPPEAESEEQQPADSPNGP